MKVVITGSGGFVGRDTQKYFLEKGIEAIGFDILNGQDLRTDEFSWFLEKHKPDVVLHEAAIARFADADANPRLAYEVNTEGTKNVVEACGTFNIPLVYASTGSVYMPIEGDMPIKEDYPIKGNSVYGCSKATAESYVQDLDKWMILRYSHLYGKEKVGHGLIGGFLKKMEEGNLPELMGGEQTNDFCYIKDIVNANYLAVKQPLFSKAWNQIYNIGSGVELSARKAGDILCKVVGWKLGVKITKAREVDAGRFVYDISKAKRLLGYKPQWSFEKGLKDMLK